MPYYAVATMDLFRCVLADDKETACVAAVNQHLNDVGNVGVKIGEMFVVHEYGNQQLQYIEADAVQTLGKFTEWKPSEDADA